MYLKIKYLCQMDRWLFKLIEIIWEIPGIGLVGGGGGGTHDDDDDDDIFSLA